MAEAAYAAKWRDFIKHVGFTVRPRDAAAWQAIVKNSDAEARELLAWLPAKLKAYTPAARAILPLLDRNSIFLDFGGNCGLIGWHLHDRVAEYHLMDISPDALEMAQSVVLREQPNCFFHLSNGEDLANLNEASYTFVYAKAVIQHLPRRLVVTYLREFCRVLRPGSMLYFTNVFESFGEKVAPSSEEVSWHVREIPMAELHQVLDAAGFELTGIDLSCDLRPGGAMSGWVKALKRAPR